MDRTVDRRSTNKERTNFYNEKQNYERLQTWFHFIAGDLSFGIGILIGDKRISSFSGVVMSACGSGPNGGIG